MHAHSLALLPLLSLTDMMYCTPEKKTTPPSASTFRHMDFASLCREIVCDIALRDSVVFSAVQTVLRMILCVLLPNLLIRIFSIS
jgi:hypothetical protein